MAVFQTFVAKMYHTASFCQAADFTEGTAQPSKLTSGSTHSILTAEYLGRTTSSIWIAQYTTSIIHYIQPSTLYEPAIAEWHE
jgi:hypothetical protein